MDTIEGLLGPRTDKDSETIDSLLGPAPSPLGTAARALVPMGHTPVQSGAAFDDFFTHTAVGRVLDAIGQGAAHGWGAESLRDSFGQTAEVNEALGKLGMFTRNEKDDWFSSTAKAFNEAVIRPAIVGAAGAIELGERAFGAAFGAAQGPVASLGAELGAPRLARDVAALPEALIPELPGAHGQLEAARRPSPRPGALREGVAGERAARAVEAGEPATAARDAAVRALSPSSGVGTIMEAADAGVFRGDRAYLGLPEDPAPPPAARPSPEVAEPPAAAPAAAPPTLAELARSISPEVGRYETLAGRREEVRLDLDRLADERRRQAEVTESPYDARIVDLDRQIDELSGLTGRNRQLRSISRNRDHLISQRDAWLEDRLAEDTPEMAALRKEVQELDYAMRDLAEPVSAAYRAAADRLSGDQTASVATEASVAPAPAPEAAAPPSAAVEGEPPRPTVGADRAPLPPVEGEAAALSRETTLADLEAIRADVKRQVEAAGRSAEEADVAAQIEASHYEALAARFGGRLGSALELYRSLGPEVVRGADRETKRLADAYNQIVYHGSPYIFDKFTLDKMGTGEGVQAFGWGLYFTDKKEIAQWYRETLSKNRKDIGKESFDLALKLHNDYGIDLDEANFIATQTVDRPDNYFDAIYKGLSASLKVDVPYEKLKNIWNDAVKFWKDRSRLYHVEISDNEYLLWDEPLSKQSKKIRDMIGDAYIKVGNERRTPDQFLIDIGNEIKNNNHEKKGEELYGRLAYELGSDRNASEALRDAGINGIKFLDNASRSIGEGTYNYVLFDDAAAKIIDYEQRQRELHGNVRFREGARPVVSLFKAADASTFFHEAGHRYLWELERLAARPDAPADLRADWQTIREWLGTTDEKPAITRAQHEKFARGFERYLMEGRAPTTALARAFESLKRWLTDIYRTVARLRSPITDEVRAVMDRLVARPENERPTIAAEPEPARSLADIHEADAASTPPAHAAAAADVLSAEIDRAISAHLPKEMADELIRGSRASERSEPVPSENPEVSRAPGGSERPDAGGAPAARAIEPSGGEAARAGASVLPDTVERARSEEPAAERGNPELARPPEPESVAPPAGDSARAKFEPGGGDLLVDKAGNIRLENLTNDEDVREVIRRTAARNDDFLAARRGVISDAQVVDLAEALGMTAGKLGRRKLGQAFNAEQVMAARQLLVKSATNVKNLAAKVATGGEKALARYTAARLRHQMIQEQVAGLTAEAGRALRAFRSIAGQSSAKALELVLNQTGMDPEKLKLEAQLVASMDEPAQVSRQLMDARQPSYKDMVVEIYINNLISGPITHLGYTVHNGLLIASTAIERGIAGAIGALHGGERVYMGEAGAALFGMAEGLRSGLSAAWRALKTNEMQPLPSETPAMAAELGHQSTQIFHPRKAVTGSNLAARLQQDRLTAGLGRALAASPTGLLVTDVAGTLIRAPGRPIQAIHAMTRFTAYAAELHALAYRDAVRQGLEGRAKEAAIAKFLKDPPKEAMELAAERAIDLSLMRRPEFTGMIGALSRISNSSLAAKIVVPFVSIVSNVLHQGLVERSPLGFLHQDIRDNLLGRNGAIARDEQAAKMILGSMVVIPIALWAANQDTITGEGPDPLLHSAERAQWLAAGYQPYSINVAGHWFSYRGGPIGTLIGSIADYVEITHRLKDNDDVGMADAALQILMGVARSIENESWLRGVADLLKTFEEPESRSWRYASGIAANFAIPYSVGLGQVARAIDPYMRQARDTMSLIKARLPGLSTELFPKRDIWGNEIKRYGTLTVNGPAPFPADELSKKLYELEIFPGPVRRQISGVDLTESQFDEYARRAGRLARTLVEQVTHQADWEKLPIGVKQQIIRSIFSSSRRQASAAVVLGSRGTDNDIMAQAVQNKRELFEGGE